MPTLPRPGFVIGVTGHRSSHPSFPGNSENLEAALSNIFDRVASHVGDCVLPDDVPSPGYLRLVTLLADGADHLAASLAIERRWQLTTPLPFAKTLNAAINAKPVSSADARAVLAGGPVADEATAGRLAQIATLTDNARLLELADDDKRIEQLFLAAMDHPGDILANAEFSLATAERAALAGRILIEQSDLVIAIWDGASTANVGGTGHTALMALEAGSPVLWIDPAAPENWQMLLSPEALIDVPCQSQVAAEPEMLRRIVERTIMLDPLDSEGKFAGIASLRKDAWRDQSSLRSHAFRRIEALFGEERLAKRLSSIRQRYEHPDLVATGSGKALLEELSSLPGGDPSVSEKITKEVLRRFAWTDGVSSHLSDRYRSGMVVNFLLGAAAIIAGILYLPLVDATQKWIFVAIELVLLLAIIANTIVGQRARLHGRWFETRRAAEYLRHSPMMVALGVARPPGAWPRGVNSWWPEWYAQHSLRSIDLPVMRIEKPYLRALLKALHDHHIVPQRDYHRYKAARLDRVHHNIDRLAETLFITAVSIVTLYLVLVVGVVAGIVSLEWLTVASKWFTVGAVALPTFGGAFAAIRYFGDFDRFAEISQVTAEKLDSVSSRIGLVLAAPEDKISYRHVAELIHATDEIVVSEIQNWQAVFSGKKTSVPA